VEILFLMPHLLRQPQGVLLLLAAVEVRRELLMPQIRLAVQGAVAVAVEQALALRVLAHLVRVLLVVQVAAHILLGAVVLVLLD
jgi:hypothetical protein